MGGSRVSAMYLYSITLLRGDKKFIEYIASDSIEKVWDYSGNDRRDEIVEIESITRHVPIVKVL